MSLGSQITEKLNRVEAFVEKASLSQLPLKILGWLLLFFALMITNLLALAMWPISSFSKLFKSKEVVVGQPIDVRTVDELDKLLSEHQTVLVDFWAQWCGPCLLMDASIKEIAKEYTETVAVVKVDASLAPELTKAYAVRGLPTLILFSKGEEVTRKSGSMSKGQLVEMVS